MDRRFHRLGGLELPPGAHRGAQSRVVHTVARVRPEAWTSTALSRTGPHPRQRHATRDIMVVVHEVNDITVPDTQRQLDFLISQDPGALLAAAIRRADTDWSKAAQSQELVDFYVHTVFNIRAHARGC
jgi:hypothetical protein